MSLRNKKFILYFSVSAFFLFLGFCPASAAAWSWKSDSGFVATGEAIGYSAVSARLGSSPSEIAGNIINAVLVFLGVIFLVLTLYGGFLYLTAAGNDDKVKKAVEIIKRSVIGLLIVLSAYAVTAFIFTTFQPLIPAK